MNRNRLQIQVGHDVARLKLLTIVGALNGENRRLSQEDRAALVRYVEAWNTAGRNPWDMKLTRADAQRFKLDNLASAWTWTLAPIGLTRDAKQVADYIAARGLRPRERAGGAYWCASPNEHADRDMAVLFVGLLLTNPLRGKLSDGPCQRPQCRRWFIKKRPGQKTCNVRCLGIVKAGIATSEERTTKHEQDIKLAQKAIREWKPSHGDWKEFVSKTIKLTVKWVSRNTANKKHPHRELRPPSHRALKGRKTKS